MFGIANLTKRKIPKIPWQKIKEKVLGKKYEVSLVFAPPSLMKKINIRYRKKKETPCVLSFALSPKEGEVFINIAQKKYHLLFLFIHALLHLKRFRHGDKMENEEKKLWHEISPLGSMWEHRP